MLLPLPWAIYLLVIALSDVAARAVDTNITSLPNSNISSSMLSDSANVTASSESCTDIKTCRTLDQIVVSCLVTILACVWFAVHRNVPAPKREPSYHSNLFIKSAQWAWSVILGQREAAMVFGVALLAPEWILAWALRQAITAWQLVRKLEAARLQAKYAQMERFSGSSHAGDIAASAAGHSSTDESVATHADSETSQLINRRTHPSTIYSTCDKCEGRGNQCDRVASERRVGKGDERWKWSHAFLVTMGGFNFHNEDGPLYPLSPENVVELVGRGHLVPPTADEIANQSKGDALSKGVAIAQTLWFVVQCIARRAEQLPVTSLEVMTLAYTVMTVAMYAAWWDKPLNVSCAVHVPEEEVEEEEVDEYTSICDRIAIYIVGGQDDYVDLRKCKRVPTFWAGRVDGGAFGVADVIALLVAMAFGAVHCIAWDSEFQSHLELQLWRWSAITIVAVPVALAVISVVAGGIMVWLDMGNDPSALLTGVLYTPIAIVYVAARLVLITLSFTSLRALPLGAYKTVQWTTFIPHI